MKSPPARSKETRSTFRRHATASSLSVWASLKEAVVPVLAYQACATFAYAAFAASVIVGSGLDAGGAVLLFGLAVTTAAGVVAGQVLAFLRVRTWILLLFGAFCWGASMAVAASSLAGLGELGVLVALALWLFPIALTGGLWSLETHRALWSSWLPLLYATSSVLIWAQTRGNVGNWFAGEKWAIWDLVTGAVLGTTIVLLLIYLVTRETHRLALWRRGPTAPLAPTLIEKGASRPRLTPFSVVLLLGMAVVLTVGTAIVSPYLWRTGPADDGDQQVQAQPEEGPEEPEEQPEESELLKRLAKALQELAEQGVEAGKQAGGAVCSMITLAILALIGFLIGYRPLKRLFLIRHLRDPFWAVPTTTRIEHGWRLVEIALGDAGVYPRPGEDAAGLARRAAPVLARLSPVEVHGLEDAAEVADRVRFGLGVGPEDQEVMERFAGWAMDTVWERLGDREQIRCLYREL